jgi:hypothetical protein
MPTKEAILRRKAFEKSKWAGALLEQVPRIDILGDQVLLFVDDENIALEVDGYIQKIAEAVGRRVILITPSRSIESELPEKTPA